MRVTTGSLPAVAKPERRPRKSDEAKMDTSLSYSVRNSTTGSVMVDGSAIEGSEEGLDTVDTVKVAAQQCLKALADNTCSDALLQI